MKRQLLLLVLAAWPAAATTITETGDCRDSLNVYCRYPNSAAYWYPLGPLTPGQTVTLDPNNYLNPYYTAPNFMQVANGQGLLFGSGDPNSSQHLEINCGSIITNNPPQYVTNNYCLNNGDPVSHNFNVYFAGGLYASITLGAGQTYCFSKVATTWQNATVQCQDCNPVLVTNNVFQPPTEILQPNTGNAPFTTTSPGSYNATNTSPITFSQPGTTGLALDSTLRDVGSALYDATTQFSARNDQNLQNLKTSDNALFIAVSNGFGYEHSDDLLIVSNISSSANSITQALSRVTLSVSNYAGGSTNLVTVTNSTDLAGVTNLLTRIADELSRSNTTGSGQLPLPAVLTNYEAASAFAQQQLAPVLNQFDGLKNSLTGPGPLGDVSSPEMTWQFTTPGVPRTFTLDLNPLHNAGLAGVFATARTFLAWLLVAFYLYRIVNDAYQAVDSLGKIRGQSVQDLDVDIPVIGNLAGALLALVLPVVFLAAWAVLLGLFFASWTGGLDVLGTFNTHPLQHASAISLELFTAFFPFDLLVGLTTGYLVFKLTLAKALLVYGAIARVLLGG